MNAILRFCLTQRFVVGVLVLLAILAGFFFAPFDWDLWGILRDPVPVDAIPDLGENQQIVFTPWEGRSPQDIEDQITYPLTVSLLGLPGVKTVRSYSYLGFSTVYVVFEESVEFYWSRSRILEKLSSLPTDLLPDGVRPQLGPDATALGQIFMYTLEGRDEKGRVVGGWDLHELRSIQDYTVRYALSAVEGVSEVASVGGFVREYQIDADPDLMRMAGVTLRQVFDAVRSSNIDVGARTIEINRAEYVIRGIGFLRGLEDIRETVVVSRGNVPIRVQDVAQVGLGPALRRGVLDKGGSEVVGGIVTVRYGENPLSVIQQVKQQISRLTLPNRVLDDGTISQVQIIPFYDRTGLIHETLGTLRDALTQEVLISLIVVVVMVMHLRTSLVVAGALPLAVLMSFIGMKLFSVNANIVALSGIAIAIGTMVDMGIVVSENILRRVKEAPENDLLETVLRASKEVSGAVLTAVATTIVSFLPVFTLTAAEGKLFRPLAYTKTFALVGAGVLAVTVVPAGIYLLLRKRGIRPESFLPRIRFRGFSLLQLSGFLIGILLSWKIAWWLGLLVISWTLFRVLVERQPERYQPHSHLFALILVVLGTGILLSREWLPLGPGAGLLLNMIFVGGVIGGILFLFRRFQVAYPQILKWCLNNKRRFLAIPTALVVLALFVWQGYGTVFFFIPEQVREFGPGRWIADGFPGLGREFMPPLDEGSFLYMPTTMPHASIGEAQDVLQKLDMAMSVIPEVDMAVGKLGRAETALDPAPISMIETVINYKPEYSLDDRGRRERYRYDWFAGDYEKDEEGNLIPDPGGRYYRNWRSHIRTSDDIWQAIVDSAQLPGTTSAPKLQPIGARLVMLQSGIRAPMGVKVSGSDLEDIEGVLLKIEQALKKVPFVAHETVIADRIVGKPYLEIVIDRRAIARYGLSIRQVQDVVEVAIGGKKITTVLEGRERYPVRVRYLRELRDRVEDLERILVPTPEGAQIPLVELSELRYVRGPQSIKSEDGRLVGYVLFDKVPETAEVDAVEQAQAYLKREIETFEQAEAELMSRLGRQLSTEEAGALPGLDLRGCESPRFTGSYENQVRSQKTLSIVIPAALLIILLLLYLQFGSLETSLMVFAGVAVAAAGGFLLIWLYGFPGFMNIELFGYNLRDIFGIRAVNLSVAVWVGFIALFGIATDDGVVIATYLRQSFSRLQPTNVEEVRAATIEAGMRRVRPCLMTTATTLLAMLPILTSTGRGSDIMTPMAVPVFGGMVVALLTMFVVPTLFCAAQEKHLSRMQTDGGSGLMNRS